MNGTHPDLLTISHFATATRLSQKALRLYDSMGLLTPLQVDPQSGYRYYHPDQIEQARLIGWLRTLQMPLNRIHEVLQAPETARAGLVKAYWREVEQEMREKKGLVQYLADHLEKKENLMFDIHTRHVPEQKIVSMQRRVYARDLPPFIEEAFHRLQQHLEASNLPFAGAPFVIYHGEVNEDSDGPVEVCIPFTGTLDPLQDMTIRLEPAHQEAYTSITKDQCVFPEILRAYDAVDSWIKAEHKACAGSSREVYFANWGTAGPDELVCDIAFPYA